MFCGLVTLEMEFEDTDNDLETIENDESRQCEIIEKNESKSMINEIYGQMMGLGKELKEIKSSIDIDVSIESHVQETREGSGQKTSESGVQTENSSISIGTQTDVLETPIEIISKSKQIDSQIINSLPPSSQYDIEEISSNLFQQYGNERNIEKEIQKRKINLEYTAEKAARLRQAQWVRDRISLQQAIDNLFSDHLILHEKAHALRLHFEREKSIWSKAFENKIQNLKSHPLDPSNFLDPFSENQHQGDSVGTSLKSPTNSDSDEFQYFKPLTKKCKRSPLGDVNMDLPLLNLNDENIEISNQLGKRTTEMSPQNSSQQNFSHKPNRKFRFPTKQ
jgi:hypothetical protein